MKKDERWVRAGIQQSGLSHLATRVAFSTAIYAKASNAGRSMDFVKFFPFSIISLELRHAAKELLLDRTHQLASARDGRLLIATTFARHDATVARTVHTQKLGVGSILNNG